MKTTFKRAVYLTKTSGLLLENQNYSFQNRPRFHLQSILQKCFHKFKLTFLNGVGFLKTSSTTVFYNTGGCNRRI